MGAPTGLQEVRLQRMRTEPDHYSGVPDWPFAMAETFSGSCNMMLMGTDFLSAHREQGLPLADSPSATLVDMLELAELHSATPDMLFTPGDWFSGT